MIQPEQAVIFCGGQGTRLRPLTDSVPKPMVSINEKPFLEYLLQQLSEQGLKRFLLLTGYLGEQIRDYFGDGSRWGWVIAYSHGPVEWETGRRFWEARQQMDSQFLLLYSDNFAQFRMSQILERHHQTQSRLTLLLAPKNNGNIRVSPSGQVEAYIKNRVGHDLNYVEIGYMLVERDSVLVLCSKLKGHPDYSFSSVLESLVAESHVAGLVVRDPYHSISDVDRLELMKSYLSPKKILLIDRDGVINQKAPRGEYVSHWSSFKWISETRQALRKLAENGFKFIIISNQAGVARGMVEESELRKIHQSMVSELKKDGVEILGIYVCPHHWDANCDCRKPSPGLFFQVAKDHALRMDRTVFIGDDSRDGLAADNAGCHSILVGEGSAGGAETLLELVPWICNKYHQWETANGQVDAAI